MSNKPKIEQGAERGDRDQASNRENPPKCPACQGSGRGKNNKSCKTCGGLAKDIREG